MNIFNEKLIILTVYVKMEVNVGYDFKCVVYYLMKSRTIN